MATANSISCMEEFIGGIVIGVLVNEFGSGTRTLLFHGDRALTFTDKGAYWAESQADVKRVLKKIAEETAKKTLLLKAAAEYSS